MKKFLFISALSLLSTAVGAAECIYHPHQEVIRSAENLKEVEVLGNRFDANETFPCGGSLSQLAVLRGNLDILGYLYAHGADFNADVSLNGYEIPGAPDQIPFPLFVAGYAPNSALMDVLINNGINFKVQDRLGHDVFWYLEKNPVLRHTYLTKKGWDAFVPLAERIRRLKAGQAPGQRR